MNAPMARFELRTTKDSSFTVFDNTVAESYKSQHAARTESQVIFLQPGLFSHPQWNRAPVLRVLEFGFGLGTNFCNLANAISALPLEELNTIVEFHSCENDLAGIEFFLENGETSAAIAENDYERLKELIRSHFYEQPKFRAQLHVEPIENFLRCYSGEKFDIVFFDPFSPSAAPECWHPEVFKAIASRCAPEARLVTYSVARKAKDGLTLAGFHWKKLELPEILQKRNSLLAVLN